MCCALLERAGFESEIATTLESLPLSLNCQNFGLIITSYPFSAPLFEEIKKRGISTLILCDDFDENLLNVIKEFKDSYCMMKPLDYARFRSLVREVMTGKVSAGGGYHFIA